MKEEVSRMVCRIVHENCFTNLCAFSLYLHRLSIFLSKLRMGTFENSLNPLNRKTIESDPQLAIQINYFAVPKQHNSDLHEV